MAKVGRKKVYHRFDADFRQKLTPRQNMYLDANYGKGVYGSKKYKEVLQELKIIKEGDNNDIDWIVAKREFAGDKRIFNKIKPNFAEKVEADGLANTEGEFLNSYVPINNNYVLAYLTVPGYNQSPIDTIRIIPSSSLGDFKYEE